MDGIQDIKTDTSTENNQVRELDGFENTSLMKNLIESSKDNLGANHKQDKPEPYEKLPIYSVEHAGQALDWVQEVTKKMLTYQEKCKNAIKVIQEDPHYTKEGRVSDIQRVNRMRQEREKFYKEQALKAVERVIGFLDGREEKLRIESEIRPQTVSDWENANTRVVFIQEDMQNWVKGDSSKILKLYAYYKSVNDNVGMYLVGRYGMQALERANARLTASKLEKAIKEATPIDNDALDEILKMRNRATNVDYWVKKNKTTEEDDRLKTRFGIDRI